MISRRIYNCFVMVVILFGSIQMLNAQWSDWIAPDSADTLVNPFKGDQVAIQEGKALFNSICVVCHGKEGIGNGINASTLNKQPADFTSPRVQRQSDGALFWKIGEGNPPMLSFKSALTEKQRWKIVNYLRQFNINLGDKNVVVNSQDPPAAKTKQSIKNEDSKPKLSLDNKVFNPFEGEKDGKKIFNSVCAACHTIGKGRRVGPDLAGVTLKRPEDWLFNWIKCPMCRVEMGDTVAVKLYKEFDKVIMPNHGYLEDGQLANILKFIEGEGDLISENDRTNNVLSSNFSSDESTKKRFSNNPSSGTMTYKTASLILIGAIAFIFIVISFLVVRIRLFLKTVDNNLHRNPH